jgi:excisionase family DNA binding protein
MGELTMLEAMAYLRISRSTLYHLMWSKQIIGCKVGSTWRFTKESLDNCKVWTPVDPPPCTTPDINLDVQYQQI